MCLSRLLPMMVAACHARIAISACGVHRVNAGFSRPSKMERDVGNGRYSRQGSILYCPSREGAGNAGSRGEKGWVLRGWAYDMGQVQVPRTPCGPSLNGVGLAHASQGQDNVTRIV